jgi:alpha-tubulin suppressor-like RCC1 family protein
MSMRILRVNGTLSSSGVRANYLVDGDAAQPALSFYQHQDTGLYYDGSGALGVAVDGTPVASFDNNEVSVQGNVSATYFLGNGSLLEGIVSGGGGNDPWTVSGDDLTYAAGNVGIGTTQAPTATLDVRGTVALGDGTVFTPDDIVALKASHIFDGYTYVTKISAATGRTLALTSDGVLWGWGMISDDGGSNVSISAVPVVLSSRGSLAGKTIVAIATSSGASYAVDSQGNLHAWGYGNFGLNSSFSYYSQPTRIQGTSGGFGSLNGVFIHPTISPGIHTLVVANGNVHAWGRGSEGQLGNNSTSQSNVPVQTSLYGSLVGKTAVAVAAGQYHSVALDSLGQVHTWGYNNVGQLGRNNTTNSNVPVNISGFGSLSGKSIVQVRAGSTHCVALDASGGVHAWGREYGAGTQTPIPVSVSGGSLSGMSVSFVQAGETFNVALAEDGTVHAWGNGTSGQLGTGATNASLSPVEISGGSLAGRKVKGLASLSSRSTHALVIDETNAVHAWGSNQNGAIGDETEADALSPVQLDVVPSAVGAWTTSRGRTTTSTRVGIRTTSAPVADLDVRGDVAFGDGTVSFPPTAWKTLKNDGTMRFPVAIDAGFQSSAAAQFSGALYLWGNNHANPSGGSQPRFLVPTLGFLDIPTRRVVAVACGKRHYLALTSSGEVYAAGSNERGQLSSARAIQSSGQGFAKVSTLPDTITAVAANFDTSLALDSSGKVWTWGNGGEGQIGNSTTTNINGTPVNLNDWNFGSGLLNGKNIVAISYCRAVDDQGQVYGWGPNGFYQLGNNTTTLSAVPILMSQFGSIVGKTIVAVESSEFVTLMLDAEGHVHSCGSTYTGRGTNGENRTPMDISAVVSSSLYGKTVTRMSMKYRHAVVVTDDGEVHSWGDDATVFGGVNVVTPYRYTSGSVASATMVDARAGDRHSLAIDDQGYVHSWGLNEDGQLGINSTTNVNAGNRISRGYFTNFTGQHRCYIDDDRAATVDAWSSLEGLIVVSDKNTYATPNRKGPGTVGINEALPLVSLSRQPNDRRVFGVLSLVTEQSSAENADALEIQRALGDVRPEINGVGEGAVWVCDANGPLQAGEYITSSIVPGYGMRQESDSLKNYTVAKITMDCDFDPPSELVHVATYESSGRRALDARGHPVWHTLPDPQPAYPLRFVLGDGTVTSEEDYEARKESGEAVYKAAFVGCTYHCG